MNPSPRRSGLLSVMLHGGAIALVLLTTGRNSPLVPKLHERIVTPRDIITALVPQTAAPHKLAGGGGGGELAKTQASFGRLPRAAPRQFVPPSAVIVNEDPKLPIEPSLVIRAAVLPEVDISRYGDPHTPPGPPSSGLGKGGGIGNGKDGGIGDGKGPGYGPGSGADGITAGFRGVTTQPILVSKAEPLYSDEARKARLQGVVVLQIEVDARGQAEDIQVVQSLGLGLDERAIEAVKGWRFRPATHNGKPVPSGAQVYVTFRLL